MSVTGGERLVVDADPLGRAPRLLGMLGGDERDRLAEVANAVDRQHRLVGELEAVVLLAGDVRVREHRVDAGHRHRLGDVDRDDARVRVRAPHRVAPEHPGRDQVARVGELALHLRHAVGARTDCRRSGRPGARAESRSCVIAARGQRTASKIFA